MPLDEVLKVSDVISVHMPYIKGQNYHMINEEFISKMKNDSFSNFCPSKFLKNTADSPSKTSAPNPPNLPSSRAFTIASISCNSPLAVLIIIA